MFTNVPCKPQPEQKSFIPPKPSKTLEKKGKTSQKGKFPGKENARKSENKASENYSYGIGKYFEKPIFHFSFRNC